MESLTRQQAPETGQREAKLVLTSVCGPRRPQVSGACARARTGHVVHARSVTSESLRQGSVRCSHVFLENPVCPLALFLIITHFCPAENNHLVPAGGEGQGFPAAHLSAFSHLMSEGQEGRRGPPPLLISSALLATQSEPYCPVLSGRRPLGTRRQAV